MFLINVTCPQETVLFFGSRSCIKHIQNFPIIELVPVIRPVSLNELCISIITIIKKDRNVPHQIYSQTHTHIMIMAIEKERTNSAGGCEWIRDGDRK